MNRFAPVACRSLIFGVAAVLYAGCAPSIESQPPGGSTGGNSVGSTGGAATGGRGSGGISAGASGGGTIGTGGAGTGGAVVNTGGTPGTGGAAANTGGTPGTGGTIGAGGAATGGRGGASGSGGSNSGTGGLLGGRGGSGVNATGGANAGGRGGATTGSGGSSVVVPPNCILSTPVSYKKDVEPFLTNSCGKGNGSGCHVTDASSTTGSACPDGTNTCGFDHAYDWITAGSHDSSCPQTPNPKRFEVVMAVINQANPPSCSKSRIMPPPGMGPTPTACQLAALQLWLALPRVLQMHRTDDSSPPGMYLMPPYN